MNQQRNFLTNRWRETRNKKKLIEENYAEYSSHDLKRDSFLNRDWSKLLSKCHVDTFFLRDNILKFLWITLNAWLKGTCLSVRTVPLRMLSKLCCGLGNLLGLIGREHSNKESEPLHANADLEGQETLGTRYCTMLISWSWGNSFDIVSLVFLENWIFGETHVMISIYDAFLSLSK